MNAKIKAIEQHMHRRIQDTVHHLNRGRERIAWYTQVALALGVTAAAFHWFGVQQALLYCCCGGGPEKHVQAMLIPANLSLTIALSFTLALALWDHLLRQVEHNMTLAANELTAYLYGKEAQKIKQGSNKTRTPTNP